MANQEQLRENFRLEALSFRELVLDVEERADLGTAFNNVDDFYSNVDPILNGLVRLHDIAVQSTDPLDDDQTAVFARRARIALEEVVDLSAANFSPEQMKAMTEYFTSRLFVAQQMNVLPHTDSQVMAVDNALEKIRQQAQVLGSRDLERNLESLRNERNRKLPPPVDKGQRQVRIQEEAQRLELLKNSDYVGYINSLDFSVLHDSERAKYESLLKTGAIAGIAARLSHTSYSPERPLSEEQVQLLDRELDLIKDSLASYRTDADVGGRRLLQEIGMLFQQMLHEHRILSVGAREDIQAEELRKFYRPSVRSIDAAVEGEIQAFLGWFDQDINTAEVLGMKVAAAIRNASPAERAQAARSALTEEERNELLRIRKKIGDYVTDQAVLARNAAGTLDDAERRELEAYISEMQKYTGWLDTILSETRPSAPTAQDAVPGDLSSVPRPEHDDSPAWNKYFEQMLQVSEEMFVDYVEKMATKLEIEDEDFAERELFKESESGLEYVRLRDFLASLSKSETRKNFYKDRLAKTHEFIRIRIEYIHLMGPWGNSALGSAVAKEVWTKFPEFGSAEMFWLRNDWEFAPEMRLAFDRIDSLMTETPGGTSIMYQGDSAIVDQDEPTTEVPRGEFSYDTAQWMNDQGAKHIRMMRRMIAETTDNSGIVPNEAKWTLAGKEYSDEELHAIFRVAYCTFLFLRGRQIRLMEPLSGGASPPKMHELDEVRKNHPLANEMNLACREVLEMPQVVTGLEIDRRWLVKLLKHRKVHTIIKGLQENKDKKQATGISGDLLNKISGLNEHDIDDQNQLTNDEIERFLWQIATDASESTNTAYTRFRTLLRSIYLSEAKSDWLGIKHTRHLHLQNAKGESDHHGYYLAPMVMEPYHIVTGHMEQHFRQQRTRLDTIFMATYDEAMKFHDRIFHDPPPELKGGVGNHQEDIQKLWKDFSECLAFTSRLRTGEDLVNWDEVKEAFEYRLRMLFSVYAKTYPSNDPTKVYDKSIKDVAVTAVRVSMVDTFLGGILNSGQTLEGFTINKMVNGQIQRSAVVFEHPYNGTPEWCNLKQYLVALINPNTPHRRKIYETIYSGTANAKNASNPKWRAYSDLRRRWNIQGESLGDYLLPQGAAHAKAKSEQQSEQNEAKAGH